MKTHIITALNRLLFAVIVAFALPFSHMKWGQSYPGDGQQGFGFTILFGLIGFAAATLYLVCGTVCHFLLRKRPVKYTVLTDLALFLLFAGVLIYGGVTAQYSNATPDDFFA